MAAIAATLAIGAASSAQAQAWIGLVVGNMIAQERQRAQEHACMMGTPPPASEIDEVRTPANQAIAEYWHAVSGGGPRDITRVFKGDRDATWSDGAMRLKHKKMTAAVDRFAQPDAMIDAEPQWFMRTGDLVHARGLWLVRDASRVPIGAYSAVFRRNLGTWHLRSITLLPGEPAPLAPVQYCHNEGDVAPYQVAFAETERLRALRQAEKDQRRREREAARAAKRNQ